MAPSFLTALMLADDMSVIHTYNGDGIRTSETVGTKKTEHLLEGTKVLKQVMTEKRLNCENK